MAISKKQYEYEETLKREADMWRHAAGRVKASTTVAS